MKEALKRFNQTILKDIPSAISSRASADGPLQLDLLAGQTTESFGQVAALASLSASSENGGGEKDERHLWPVFRGLIAKRKPSAVLGEQVASADGRRWFSGVRADMEALGYAVGGADLCAAGIGSPHIRARLFWVADSQSDRCGEECPDAGRIVERDRAQGLGAGLVPSSTDGWLVYSDNARLERHAGDVVDWNQSGRKPPLAAGSIAAAGRHSWGDNWIDCADGKKRRIEPGIEPLAHGIPGRVGLLRGYGNAIVPQLAAEFMKAFMECRP